MILGNAFEPDPRVHAEARALFRAGHEVSILGWDRDGDLPPRERVDGIDVSRLRLISTHGRGRGQAPFMLRFWGGALREGIRRRFDLLWCHDLDTLPPGLLLGAKARTPVVFDAHESYPDMVEESLGRLPTRALRALERGLVPRAAAVVTVGERLAAHYDAMGARRTVVAGNWKDPARFDMAPGERVRIRGEFGVPENAFLVADVGWLAAERQLEPLIEAVRADEGVWLLLAGRGPMEDFCRDAAARCPRIRFPGWVHGDRVAALTAASDAVFYGFDPENGNARFSAPNKLFEAVAAGIPVVTGPFGEIRKVVSEEKCGVVLRAYTPEEVRRGLAAVRRREEFTEGCARARAKYTRARADRAVTELAEELLLARHDRLATPRAVCLWP